MPRVIRTFVLLACLALAACGGGDEGDGAAGGGGDKTFEGDGFSFNYPDEWTEIEAGEPVAQAGAPVSVAVFGPAEEGSDALSVQVYRVNPPITEQNLDQASGEIANVVTALFQQADGQITSGPNRVTVGGLPGFSFEGPLVNAHDDRVQARLTLVFDGQTQYAFDCEYTPDGAEEMKRGCDQVLESFQVE